MAKHLSQLELEEFCSRAGELEPMVEAADHLSFCPACRALFLKEFRRVRATLGTKLNFEAAEWLKAEHLGYEDKRRYADGLMDDDDKEMAAEHVALCSSCDVGLKGFVFDRRENDRELSLRYSADEIQTRISRLPSRRVGGLWGPVRAAALVLLACGLTGWFGWMLLRGERSETGTMGSPSPAGPVVLLALKDSGRQIVLDDQGSLRGLEGLGQSELEAVKDALLAEDIPIAPAISELAGKGGTLRGTRIAAFELIGPRNEVVTDPQPVFRWEALPDVTSYQVLVVDSRRRKVLVSPRLPSHITEWRPATGLQRGERYSWSVHARLPGRELISPSPSDAEVRFKIVDAAVIEEMTRLRGPTDSHLVRGVLFARAGLVSEAQTELNLLLTENGDSAKLRKIIERVEAWRK